jgi:hypothetical protein
MLELTGPRVRNDLAARYRQLDIDGHVPVGDFDPGQPGQVGCLRGVGGGRVANESTYRNAPRREPPHQLGAGHTGGAGHRNQRLLFSPAQGVRSRGVAGRGEHVILGRTLDRVQALTPEALQQSPGLGEPSRSRSVKPLGPVPTLLDQPRLPKYPKMFRDRRPTYLEMSRDLAGRALLPPDQPQNLLPPRLRDRLQHRLLHPYSVTIQIRIQQVTQLCSSRVSAAAGGRAGNSNVVVRDRRRARTPPSTAASSRHLRHAARRSNGVRPG